MNKKYFSLSVTHRLGKVCLAIGLLAWSVSGNARKIQEIGADEARLMMQQPNTVVLDVRTPEEYAQGHIEGAKLRPLQTLKSNSEWIGIAPSMTIPIIVYCTVGVRSSQARVILKEHGFSNTYNLRGGIRSWEAAGYPVVKEVK